MPKELIGRRLPIGQWPTEPGDYMGPIDHDGKLCVFFLKPNARDADAPKDRSRDSPRDVASAYVPRMPGWES
jgi:hypothetical protein